MALSDATPDGREGGPEGQVVVDVLGDHPKTRILLAALTEPDRDYNVTDLARLADTDRATIYRHLDPLLELELLERTRTVGNAPMYQINHDSDAAAAFARFEWELIRALGEREERDETG